MKNKGKKKSLYQFKAAVEGGSETSESLENDGLFARACIDDIENPGRNWPEE